MSVRGTEGDSLKPDDIVRRVVSSRGDLFGEFKLVADTVPETMLLMFKASGYVHYYEGETAEDQELSPQMRELIAVAQLCAYREDRFGANHVRRLYRMGITNPVIFEAGESISPIFGWSTLSHVAMAIIMANDPNFPEGKLPPGGQPNELVHFPEMDIGRDRAAPADESLLNTPEWRYVSEIDPELARRSTAFVDNCLLPQKYSGKALGPGARELIALAALCARGEVDLAAQHIRRAYAYGINKRKVLEAISCVLPMTGALTVQIGVRAMQMVDSDSAAPGK